MLPGYYPSRKGHRPVWFRHPCRLASPLAHPLTARRSNNCGPQGQVFSDAAIDAAFHDDIAPLFGEDADAGVLVDLPALFPVA